MTHSDGKVLGICKHNPGFTVSWYSKDTCQCLYTYLGELETDEEHAFISEKLEKTCVPDFTENLYIGKGAFIWRTTERAYRALTEAQRLQDVFKKKNHPSFSPCVGDWQQAALAAGWAPPSS